MLLSYSYSWHVFVVTQNVACSLFGICVYTAEIKGTYSLKLCLGSHSPYGVLSSAYAAAGMFFTVNVSL